MSYIHIEGKKKRSIPFFYKRCSLKIAEILKITDQYNRVSYSEIESIELITANPKILHRFVENGKVRRVKIFFSLYVFDNVIEKFVQPDIESTIKEELEIFYGNNESFYQNEALSRIIFKNIFKLFFMMNLSSICIWFLMQYYFFPIIILIINIYCLVSDSLSEYKNQASIYALTKNEEKLKVHDKEWREVDAKYVYPGNIILIDRTKDFPCDVKILDGELIVDESFLTGESFPVVKSCGNFVYSGTKILQSKGSGTFLVDTKKEEDVVRVKHLPLKRRNKSKIKNGTEMVDRKEEQTLQVFNLAVGLVLKTGQETTKGKLLKSIICPPPCDYKFLNESKKIFKFLLFLTIIFCSLLLFRIRNIEESTFDKIVVIFDMFFVLVYPGLPTSLMFSISLAQSRLFKKGILCFDKERINSAGLVSLVVFDKTGTLTEEGLDVHLIDAMYKMENIKTVEESEESVMEIEPPNFEDDSKQTKEEVFIKAIDSKSNCEQNLNYVQKMKNFENDFYKEMDNEEFNCNFISEEENEEMNKNIIIEEIPSKDKIEIDFLDIGMSVCHNAVEFNDEIVGDPLDVRMFAYSNAKICDNKIIQLGELKFHILKIIDFDNKARRMSVLISFNDRFFIFTKGSPENIKELMSEIYQDYDDDISEYAMDGYRVITMACLELDKNGNPINFNIKETFNKNKPFTKEGGIMNYDANLFTLEKIGDLNHKLLGVIVFANKTKMESYGIISELTSANICCIMATGDNILTSISVAKELCLYDQEIPLLFPVLKEDAQNIYDIEWIGVGEEDLLFDKIKLMVYKGVDKTFYTEFNIAIEGKEYEFLKKDKGYSDMLLDKCKIFARMNPEQKKMLVQDFKNRKIKVAFCGDGANDMGALKEADVGIALAQNEASVASSFTSNITDISAVSVVLKEGRCALVSSFSTFKYLFTTICLQFIFYYGLFFLYFNIVSDFQSLHTDLLGTLIISMFMSNSVPSKMLSKKKLQETFFTRKTIQSTLFIIFFSTLFILAPFGYCNSVEEFGNDTCELTTALFYVYTSLVVALGYYYYEGLPHRKEIKKNRRFIIYLLLFLFYLIYLVLSNGEGYLSKLYKLVNLPTDKLLLTSCICVISIFGLFILDICINRNKF
ncbi:hypothetical protein H312_03183 [Anncaliia algerae PRA339]|uniref:P-type ATPase A domain-containing protein n=1 Tax=Anncaliia algerae PRA339 TaxID=1288291 RepID=A0A059EX34_9MICR|nr:hypothetical protein H312_03183 [Anncaliia algerae PRA339]